MSVGDVKSSATQWSTLTKEKVIEGQDRTIYKKN